MKPDSEEPARLAQLYAAMPDAELEKVASYPDSLTDAARSAVAAELLRRDLHVEPAPPAGYDEAEYRSLVTIRKYRDLPEALLAKGSLESAGIECQLVDDNMVRMDWFISNLLGGVKLGVRPEDVEAANEILSLPIPDALEIEGAETYEQPRCPNCGSLEATFEELNKPVAYVSAWVGLPLPVHRAAWRCHACGRQWEDTDPDAAHQP
jgi:hypothetical protein